MVYQIRIVYLVHHMSYMVYQIRIAYMVYQILIAYMVHHISFYGVAVSRINFVTDGALSL